MKESPSPHETLSHLEEERNREYQKLDIVSDIVKNFLIQVEKGEEVERVEDLVSAETLSQLDAEHINLLNNALQEFKQHRLIVGRYYEQYKENPKSFIHEFLGREVKGQPELEANPWNLLLTVDKQDFEHISGKEESVSGSCFIRNQDRSPFRRTENSDLLLGNQELWGKLSLINRQGSYKPEYTKVHETQHSIYDFMRKIRTGSTPEVRWKFADELKSADDFRQDIKIAKHYYLSWCIDGRLAGDQHLDKDIEALGPQAVYRKLHKILNESKLSESEKLELEGELQAFIDEYRSRYFMTIDILRESYHLPDRRKREALIYCIPPDRIERILYFVGQQPSEWVKQWRRSSDKENLLAREKSDLRSAVDYGDAAW